MSNGKQCTVGWYVDDKKISHEDEDVVTDVLNMIEKNFGKPTIIREKEHSYFGMNIKLWDDHKFEISMKKQIKDAVDSFGEEISGTVTSPCARHLWEVNENAEKLSEEKTEMFHSVTAKLLYIEKTSEARYRGSN